MKACITRLRALGCCGCNQRLHQETCVACTIFVCLSNGWTTTFIKSQYLMLITVKSLAKVNTKNILHYEVWIPAALFAIGVLDSLFDVANEALKRHSRK
jgi:hypothetical protein